LYFARICTKIPEFAANRAEIDAICTDCDEQGAPVERIRSILAVLVLCAAFPLQVIAADDGVATQVNIPYEMFSLDNGLTVIVHTDHSTPTVFVGMWYAVGSKDEPEGKSGFAHLFEHLMFQGTENRDGEYFSPFTDAGATGMNGTTSEDRTNYFATVPTGALDMALWMESDRMSYLLGAVTQEALDEQRGVVQNEKRQGENRPYAKMNDRIRAGLYPVDHPYRHSIIGSMEDLDNASLEDVHEWFRTYYGASNVVLVLAGDIDLETAKDKVTQYFSEAPAGVPLVHPKQWIPNLTENRKESMYDRVGQTRISRVWALPGLNDRDTTLMYLVNESLVANKNSPLRKVLVDDLQLATAVRGSAYGRVLSGEYNLTIDLRPGVTPEQVLPIVDEIIAAYLESGPDEQLVENAKLGVNMYMIGALERGSAVGRVLAEGYLYSNNPLYINQELEWLNAAGPEDLRSTANRWLTRGYYELTVLPFPDYGSTEASIDRSAIPGVTADANINFPDIATATLDNGMKLVVATRDTLPIVDVSFRIDAGATASPPEAPGLATFALALMDKGTTKYDAHQLAAAKDEIAMSGQLQAGVEDSSFSYRILHSRLEPSLDIAAEILWNPTYPDDELHKLKQQIAAWLATLEKSPSGAAGSLFERAVYGPDNPLGAVWTPELLEQVDRDMLLAFHGQEIAPDNMTVFMIGNIGIEEATDLVEQSFGKWKARSSSARRPIGEAADSMPRVILVDQPEAPQSMIYAGHAIAPYDPETSTELYVMNGVFGGGFEARINMNLREDKHWSYGMSSQIRQNTSGDQFIAVRGSVQTDKTMESMQEIRREYEEFVTTRPASAEELERVKLNRMRSLPGTFSTNRGFLTSIITSDSFGLPYDYAETRGARIEAVTLDAINDRARSVINPGRLTWVIVGDLAQIEDKVRSLEYGEVEVWDAFGNRVR
jgi:zinc protease